MIIDGTYLKIFFVVASLGIFVVNHSHDCFIPGDEDEVKERETKQEYNLLCDWIKQQLGDKIAKVQVSKRLSSSPCVLVSGKFGWSANMERSVVGFQCLRAVLKTNVMKIKTYAIDFQNKSWCHTYSMKV